MHASTQERFKHCIPLVPTIDVFRPPFPRRRLPLVFPQAGEADAVTRTDIRQADSEIKDNDNDAKSIRRTNNPKPVATILGGEKEIQPYNCRINITFRFYRPDYAASTTPRCKCGVPCILRPDMKGRVDNGMDSRDKRRDSGSEPTSERIKYWWTCYAGAQNDGKGCGMWRVMDAKAEGRGPFVGEIV